eukprot:365811-Chlamydomonas_euryale.AAC.34
MDDARTLKGALGCGALGDVALGGGAPVASGIVSVGRIAGDPPDSSRDGGLSTDRCTEACDHLHGNASRDPGGHPCVDTGGEDEGGDLSQRPSGDSSASTARDLCIDPGSDGHDPRQGEGWDPVGGAAPRARDEADVDQQASAPPRQLARMQAGDLVWVKGRLRPVHVVDPGEQAALSKPHPGRMQLSRVVLLLRGSFCAQGMYECSGHAAMWGNACSAAWAAAPGAACSAAWCTAWAAAWGIACGAAWAAAHAHVQRLARSWCFREVCKRSMVAAAAEVALVAVHWELANVAMACSPVRAPAACPNVPNDTRVLAEPRQWHSMSTTTRN